MLDGFVYAVGGWSQLLNTCVNFVERFDPQTNSWQVIESVKLAVASPAVVALDGLLYVTGRKNMQFFLEVFYKGFGFTVFFK